MVPKKKAGFNRYRTQKNSAVNDHLAAPGTHVLSLEAGLLIDREPPYDHRLGTTTGGMEQSADHVFGLADDLLNGHVQMFDRRLLRQ